MRKLVAALLSICLASAAGANDSAVQGVGGSLQPLTGEHPQVRMVRESVKLDIYRSHYDVAARFVFRNEGPATVTRMGFPEGAWGDVSDEGVSSFKNFRSTVDGRPVATVRRPLKSGEGSQEHHALWVKSVQFRRGQTRTVEVRYRAPMGMAAGMGINRFAVYDFTGGNWRGRVERSDLVCTVHRPATTLLSAWFSDAELPMRRSGNTWSFAWRNWEAQGSFVFRLASTVPGWLLLRSEYGPLPNWEKGRYYLIDTPAPPPVASLSGNDIDFLPPAFVEKGVTFIGLRELRDWLAGEAGEDQRRVEVVWRPGGATVLHLNGRTLGFRPGSAQLHDSDLRTAVEMPAPAQLVGGRLYVPLAPLLRTLQGRVQFAEPRQGRPRGIRLRFGRLWPQAAG